MCVCACVHACVCVCMNVYHWVRPWFSVLQQCHHSYSWLYWTDRGDTAQIQRASMDGQNIETVHNQSTSIRQPQALTIDYESQTLYWSDRSLDKILWSQVDPGSQINISSYTLYNTYSMVIFGSYLFFTNVYGVQSRNVDGTEFHYLYHFYDYFSDTCKPIYGIDIISEQRQARSELITYNMHWTFSVNVGLPFLHSSCTSITTTVSNPCEVSNGGCGALELCLLSAADPRGYSCVESTEAAAITALGINNKLCYLLILFEMLHMM